MLKYIYYLIYDMFMKAIVLASSSPRRKEILSKLRLPFTVAVSDYEEDMTLPMPPVELAKYLSAGKARAVAKNHPEAIIIAADTFIVYDNHILGKPKTEERAREMLRMLSGQENDILTGVTILDSSDNHEYSFSEITRIFMKEIPEDTINAYIKTGEPLDKAGAYALQELGAILVDRIEGDFFNAMGLPLARLALELQKFGIQVL